MEIQSCMTCLNGNHQNNIIQYIFSKKLKWIFSNIWVSVKINILGCPENSY